MPRTRTSSEPPRIDLGTMPAPRAVAKLRQADFEVAFFGAILAVRPHYPDALRALAFAAAAKGQRQRALKLAEQLAGIRPQDRDAQFTLACAQSA